MNTARIPASLLAYAASNLLALIAAALAAATLAGCAEFGDADHAQSAPRDAVSYDAARSLPPQGGSWPGDDWIDTLGGAPLRALVDEALKDQPGMAVAAARVDIARAAARGAGAMLAPVVAGNVNATREKFSANDIYPPPLGGNWYTLGQLSIGVQYDFDFWGRNRSALVSAVALARATDAEAYAARLALTTAIAQVYSSLARQLDERELLARSVALREQTAGVTAARSAAGLETRVDVSLSRGNTASTHVELRQLDEQIAVSRHQLAALLGKGPDRTRDLPRPVVHPLMQRLPDTLQLDLLGRRPDLSAARWRVEAAARDIEVAKADFLPNVSLSAFAGFTSIGLDNLLRGNSQTLGIGPAIHIPIFSGGRLRARLSAREAAYEQAVASYNEALTNALRELADQVSGAEAADAQLALQAEALHAAEQAWQQTQARHRAGLASQQQVLAAENAWIAQRRQAEVLRARQRDTQIGLIHALGGGFQAGRPTALGMLAPVQTH